MPHHEAIANTSPVAEIGVDADIAQRKTQDAEEAVCQSQRLHSPVSTAAM